MGERALRGAGSIDDRHGASDRSGGIGCGQLRIRIRRTCAETAIEMVRFELMLDCMADHQPLADGQRECNQQEAIRPARVHPGAFVTVHGRNDIT